jgi:hypothetical protein
MAQPQATKQTDKTELPPRNPVIHNAALVGAVLTPLVMLLPPRKMDLRFFVLAGAFSLSTNQLAYEYTGQSIYGRFGNRVNSIFDTKLPEGAQRTQQLLKEQREKLEAEKQQSQQGHQQQDQSDSEKKTASDVLKDVWMGGEGDDWKQKRAEEHQKSFQEGKGMSDIIFEQVADVWRGNWGSSSNKTGDSDTNGTKEPPKK